MTMARAMLVGVVVMLVASFVPLWSARPAQARVALERCDDLGVMVQYVNGGFVVRSLVRGGVGEGRCVERGPRTSASVGDVGHVRG